MQLICGFGQSASDDRGFVGDAVLCRSLVDSERGPHAFALPAAPHKDATMPTGIKTVS